MKHLIKSLTLLLLTHFAYQPIWAQPTNERTSFSVEIDPATFAFKGYGIHIRLQPKGSDHILVGFGTYAMNMPDILVNFNKKNRDLGWNLRLNQGYSLFGEYHFKDVNKSLFVGSQIGFQQYKIGHDELSDNEKFTNLLAMGYVGYSIQPFKNNFYIKPWAGIGYTSKINGTNSLSNLEYDIAPITMFLTLHLGYTF